MDALKKCFKCGEEKPRSEYYKHQKMGDGLLGKCKECTKQDVRAGRSERLEYYRQYDLARAKTPARRATKNSVQRKRRAAHPEKSIAHRAVRAAVLSGRLTRGPCEECGESETHAHHDDYSKPLDVRWLCKVCHRNVHGRVA